MTSAERGIALVTVLLFMAVLVLLGTAFLTLSSTETQIAFNERNAVQAFFLAEAGANKAIAQLNADDSYAGEANTPLGPGTFTVTVSPGVTPDKRVIEATGYIPNSSSPTRAVSVVNLTVELRPVFDDGIFANDVVRIDENSFVDSYDSRQGAYGDGNNGSEGNVGSNREVRLVEDVEIRGSVSAGHTIDEEPRTTITERKRVGASPVSFPPVVIPGGSGSDVTVENGGSDTLNPGSYGELNVGNNATISVSPGTYYFHGDMTLEDDSALTIIPSGQVITYVTGKLRVKERAQINAAPSASPTNLIIYSSAVDEEEGEPSIEFDENVKFFGAIYAPDAAIKVEEIESSDPTLGIYGSLVGKDIEIDEKQRVHRDIALAQLRTPYDLFRPVAGTWQEVIPSP